MNASHFNNQSAFRSLALPLSKSPGVTENATSISGHELRVPRSWARIRKATERDRHSIAAKMMAGDVLALFHHQRGNWLFPRPLCLNVQWDIASSIPQPMST